MAPLDEVLRRYAEDTQFRTLLDTDPASALREYPLTPEELGQVEDAVRATQPAVEAPPSASGPGRTGFGSRAVLGAGLGAAVLAGGFALGITGAVADPRPEITVARDAVPVHACPIAEPEVGEHPAVVGELHRADRVLVVGRSTAGGWLAVRDPRDLTGEPVWVQTPYLRPDRDVDGVPVRSCEELADPADAPADPGAPPTSTTLPAADGSTTTTRAGATTTTAQGGVAPTTPTTPTKPTTPTPSTTSTTKPPPTTTTTPPDTAGPKVQVTADRAFVYTDGSTEAACSSKATLDVTVAASDASAPVTIGSVTWRYTGRDGSTKTGTAAPLGGGRYRVSGLTNQVPLSGTTPLTITATATDGRGNTATGATSASLKAFSDDCIG